MSPIDPEEAEALLREALRVEPSPDLIARVRRGGRPAPYGLGWRLAVAGALILAVGTVLYRSNSPRGELKPVEIRTVEGGLAPRQGHETPPVGSEMSPVGSGETVARRAAAPRPRLPREATPGSLNPVAAPVASTLDIQVERGQAEALEQLAAVAWTREGPLPSSFSGEGAAPSTLEPIQIEPLRVPPLNIGAEDSVETGPGA